jgi:DNA-binding Lrp family transcriptional regulator
VAHFDEVTKVSMMYGEYDALIKVCTETLDQLNQFLTDKLRVLPDIFQTATLIVAKTHLGK